MTLASALRSISLAVALLAGSSAAQANDEATCPPYEVVGTGPDLVLVPGLGSSPATWDRVVSELSGDYRIHRVHIAGFAGRAADGEPATIMTRASDEIVAHLDCEGVDSALYAGHSLGGFLGLKLAAEHPDRIARLVVVDALPFYPLIFSPEATVDAVRPQAEAFRDQIMSQDDETFEAGQRMGVRALVKDSEYHETVVGWSLASDRATFAGALHALMTSDMRSSLEAITVPTTIIAAANAYVPRTRVEQIYRAAYENLADVEIATVEDSYHFIMFDQPEAFDKALRAALSEALD